MSLVHPVIWNNTQVMAMVVKATEVINTLFIIMRFMYFAKIDAQGIIKLLLPFKCPGSYLLMSEQ